MGDDGIVPCHMYYRRALHCVWPLSVLDNSACIAPLTHLLENKEDEVKDVRHGLILSYIELKIGVFIGWAGLARFGSGFGLKIRPQLINGTA